MTEHQALKDSVNVELDNLHNPILEQVNLWPFTLIWVRL